MMRRRVPLAWKNLVHSRRRLLVSVAGIAFAAVLMFMEYGFLNAMYDSQIELLNRLDADLFIVGKLSYSISSSVPFSRRRLYQALSVQGVEQASPLYTQSRLFNLRGSSDFRRHNIRVLAFNPDFPAFRDPEIRSQREALKMPDTILVDRKSKEFFGQMVPGTITELSGRQVRVVGTFELGTDLVNDGNLLISDLNYSRLFPGRPPDEDPLEQVDLGLLKVTPGMDIDRVRVSVRQVLPEDVLVLKPTDLVKREIRFWRDNTVIGFTFWLAMALAFVVGIVICYQILYTTVVDFLPQFGILKAIGYGDFYLVFLVLKQALVLSVLGFVPGSVISLFLYRRVAELTGLLMRLNWTRFSLVFLLTVGMCLVSGLLAVRKAATADPTEVFQ